jgi:adenylate cyclase
MILFMLVALISIHFISALVLRFLASIGLMLGYSIFCALIYIYQDIAFSMSYIFTAGALGFLLINVFLFIAERKEKGFITNAFGQYLSPDVIDIIVKDPSQLSLGGTRKEMTAFFSDIQGFSSISEGLTPDELVLLLNQYLTEMCDIISGYNGTVDKFEGDAIIAFWGAPLEQPDHAKLACFASIDMQKRMFEQRKEFIAAKKPELYVRMGLNSGPMVVGNMGSQNRMDYTIMGDSVNLAARLEGANKFYKNYSMISENTYKLCSGDIDVRELDQVLVVGRNEPVIVYDLMDKKNMVSGKLADMVEKYNQGLELYKTRNYQDAISSFNSALKIFPGDGPSITYIERCNQFIETPPAPDWNGVYRHTEKG